MNRDFKDVHTSEWDWIGSKIDYTISNDSTLDDLYASVDKIIEKLPQKPEIFHDSGLEIV